MYTQSNSNYGCGGNWYSWIIIIAIILILFSCCGDDNNTRC